MRAGGIGVELHPSVGVSSPGAFDDRADGREIVAFGAKIIGVREIGISRKTLSENQIAAQRLEHMLPGPDRVRSADPHGIAALPRAHDIGNQPVG